jgi:hypothetical protein
MGVVPVQDPGPARKSQNEDWQVEYSHRQASKRQETQT